MKLISCHIENFGRLHRLDCSFSDGLNIICRENGWGKSTFAAFLCAMFYGFPATRKKSPEENERHRYRPWQGGTYGGRLTFEAYGKKYEITRMFGRRESEDEFELRDLDTNIPCFDFTTGAGEELFRMDRDSFARTVYTRQQDCVTAATDDINALIGNLAETAGDMGCYEDAMKRLLEAANRLSPKRQTGRIRKREEEIKRLEREVSGREETQEQIREFSERHHKAVREAALLETELQTIEQELERIRRNEENSRLESEKALAAAGDRQLRERLLKILEHRRADAARAAASFPGPIPSRGEVEKCLKKCRDMERIQDRMEDAMLSEKEQNRLTMLEESREKEGNRPTAPEGHREKEGNRPTAPEGRREKKQKQGGLTAPFFAAAAAVLMITGTAVLVFGLLFSGTFSGNFSGNSPGNSSGDITALTVTGALLAAAGLLTAAGTAVLFRRSLFPDKDPTEYDPAEYDPAEYDSTEYDPAEYDSAEYDPAEYDPAEGDPTEYDPFCSAPEAFAREALSTEERRQQEYRILSEKERRLERLHAEWTEARRPVTAFLRGLGIVPDEDLRTQLEALRDAADDYEDACSLVREAEEDLRGFEEEMAGRTRDPGAGDRMTAKERRKEPARKTPEEQHPELRKEASCAENSSELRRRADMIHSELLKCREAAADCSHVLEELRGEQEDLEESLQRLNVLKEKQREDLTRYSRVTRAAAALKKSRESMTARYAEPIRENFCRYWETITGLSPDGIRVDANAAVTVEEMGRQRDTALLSAGYRDLAGLCLRFALADSMYPGQQRECPPLILDDPFTNLDDEKTAGALQLLQTAAGKYQIVYFTCSSSRC